MFGLAPPAIHLRYRLDAPVMRNSMLAFRVELMEGDQIIQQPLLRCDDLRALFEMWLSEHAYGKWVLGGEYIFIRNKRDADLFYEHFSDSYNGIQLTGSIWREPPIPLPPEPMMTWVAFAYDQFGNGFALQAGYNYMPAGMKYIGFATVAGNTIPPLHSFTWVPIATPCPNCDIAEKS